MKRLLPLVLALVTLTACAPASTVPDGESGYPVYFLSTAESARGGDALQRSYEDLPLGEDSTLQETAVAVVERLLTGSIDPDLHSPFPSDTRLLSLKVLDRRAFVDLSGSFFFMDGIALTMADYCLTLSLTAIEGIRSVSVTVDGRALSQQPRQIFQERDIILSDHESALQLVPVSLYFVDEAGVLTAEERILELYEGDTQSAALVAALLEGPESDSLYPIIPESFRISSVKTENGVCRIHLSAGALSSLPRDEYAQRLLLISLHRSLYSLDHIKDIRLLADGVELERFGQVLLSDMTGLKPNRTK